MPAESFWDYIDQLVDTSEVVIDRPKGSAHSYYPDMIYPLDYGYLAGTTSSDGGGIDVWIGSQGARKASGVVCTVDLVKRDTEIKLLLGCSDEEMAAVVRFINQHGMGGWLVRR